MNLGFLLLLGVFLPDGISRVSADESANETEIVDSCRPRIDKLRSGTKDLGLLLEIGSCLQSAQSKDSLDALRALLRPKLPNDWSWYVSILRNFREEKRISAALNFAGLIETKSSPSVAVSRELAEVYVLSSRYFHAGMAYLRQLQLDSNSHRLVQHQMESLVKSASGEYPAAHLLDSLAGAFPHTGSHTLDVLETLCWSSKHYSGAFKIFMRKVEVIPFNWTLFRHRVQIYFAQGLRDYAALILERAAWRTLAEPNRSEARLLFHRIHYGMGNWPTLAKEGDQYGWKTFSDEERLIYAAALTREARPSEALAVLQALEKQPQSQWTTRVALWKAQNFFAQRKFHKAREILRAEKNNPNRREQTGPILFWEAFLSIHEGKTDQADSLLVLASAYAGEPETQTALEYRHYLLLDSGQAGSHFFRGLAEAPYSRGEKMKSLDQVPEESGLWPFAQIEKALLLQMEGSRDSAIALLDKVTEQVSSDALSVKAQARAAFFREKTRQVEGSALARYQDLLVRYQQGVAAEFSRERLRLLK